MNRVALITGASRGLGSVIASLLAAQGYDLVISARGGVQLARTAASLMATYGNQVRAIVGDVSDPDHRRALVEEAQGLGGLSILINNASELGPSPLPPLADYPLDRLLQVLAVNLIAPLALVQETLPLLKEGGGLIVNVSSDAARGGYPGWGGYGSSKAALELVSLTLADELSDAGVGVVTVDPGDLRTDMHQQAFPGEDISDRPLPEVTAPFWLWLFGQEALAVSGQRYEAQGEQWEVRGEAG